MEFRAILPFAAILLFTACGRSGPASDADAMTGTKDHSDLAERVSHISGNAPIPGEDPAVMGSEQAPQQGGTLTHTIHSPQYNMPMAQLDMPAHWKYEYDARSGNWGATGNDLVVKNYGYQGFMYAMGEMGYYYQQAGGKMRQPIGPEEVLRQDLEPLLRKDGISLLGSADAPAIARADQQGMDGLVSFGQVRKTSRALATDWKKGDRRYLAVIHWNAMESPDMVNWGYYVTVMETNTSAYDKERASAMNTLASVRYNPAYFAAYNQQEQQKAQQSWSSHNARMQQNQAAFDAQQRAYRENTNAINEAIMGTYRTQRDASDRGQDAFINTIRGEQNAIDPHTGEAIKIEHGHQQYWMNQHGEYYGTDDVMHDPNIGNTSPYDWQQVPTQP